MYEPYDYDLGGHGMVWYGTVWFGLEVVVVVADTAEIGCKSRSYHAWDEAGGVQASEAFPFEKFTSRRQNLVDSR